MQSSDYTLIIPTFNRDDSLSRLLKYLEAQNFPYPIHVLDSSVEEIRETNRELIESVQLECRQVVFSEDTHPFDKFRDGVAEVETELCGLCADDDVILVDGLRESIEFLLANPDYSVAHGYYFQFLYEPKEIFVSTITYYTPSYTNDEPLERLQALMRHYQALTYGTYRSEVLLKVFDNVRPVTSILGRELLSSALAAVYGKVARLPNLFYGRSLGPSASYSCWHPLEWVINDPTDLFSSYKLYRDILLSQTLTSRGQHNGSRKRNAQY